MDRRRAADVLIVSLGSTAGLRRADDELADSMRRAGASVARACAEPPAPLPTLMLTDLAWARAARATAGKMLAQLHGAVAVIYSSTTAALLWPRPGAIRFDAVSRANRPGRHGLWQRPLERRRLAQAPLWLPWSEGALLELPAPPRPEKTIVLPVPIAASTPDTPARDTAARDTPARDTSARDTPAPDTPARDTPAPDTPAPDTSALGAWAGSRADADPANGEPPAGSRTRDIAAITYAANPSKKGLDRVLSAWRRVRAARRAWTAEELVVAGASARELERAGLIVPNEAGVRAVGSLAAEDYRALLRRARVFVCAPRREDFGIAQLEALADGCLLVTNAAPGPYAALPIARTLDPRLVGEDLTGSLLTALDDPATGYAERARVALAPFRREAIDRLVARELLPRLLSEAL
jgi:glycosyltransferase involved in cell wall biosynthesis